MHRFSLLAHRLVARLRAIKAERGAFDVASIIIGVVLLGILGGGIYLTTTQLVPWAQDKGAQQDLAAVQTSQGTAKGKDGTYLNTAGLETAGYLTSAGKVAIGTDSQGSCYVALTRSASGKTFYRTDKSAAPAVLVAGQNPGCVSGSGMTALRAEVEPPPVAMTTAWNTTGACATVTVPVRGTINATIDWGDGSTSPITAANPAHTYTDGLAEHEITINGTFTDWVGIASAAPSASCLKAVSFWGPTGTTNLAGAFYGATNLTSVSGIPSSTTDLNAAFRGANKFNQPVADWDTSRVTNMTAMFHSATLFNSDITGWDTSKVASMAGMFTNAAAFDRPIGSWDTSSVTNMSSMFSGTAIFNQPLSTWNTSAVTNMSTMFSGAQRFNQPINAWNTSAVTAMNHMFSYAPEFNQPIGGWNTSAVGNTSYMFAGASKFDQPIGGWNTSSVTTMQGMFNGASAFRQPLASWNTANVTNMSTMFMSATVFNQNISGWNVAKVTSYTNFRDFSALTAGNAPTFT